MGNLGEEDLDFVGMRAAPVHALLVGHLEQSLNLSVNAGPPAAMSPTCTVYRKGSVSQSCARP